MANLFELTAQAREQVGKSASRRLRREAGLIPAIMYGAGKPPVKLSFKQNELRKATEHEAFFSHILTIHTASGAQQVIIKALQRHPVKDLILHMDFLRISATEKLMMRVPLHFSGEQLSPGVKSGGVIDHLMNDLEIKCLPTNLPEFITIDVSQLELNQALYLNDIKLPHGVELLYPQDDTSHNPIVASVRLIREAVEQEIGSADVAVIGAATKIADSADAKSVKKDTPKK